jgi:hypothetical protein
MYGGHIVEDWDRRLAGAYLLKYFNEGLLEGLEMFPGFMTPGNSLSHKQVSTLRGCMYVCCKCCAVQFVCQDQSAGFHDTWQQAQPQAGESSPCQQCCLCECCAAHSVCLLLCFINAGFMLKCCCSVVH